MKQEILHTRAFIRWLSDGIEFLLEALCVELERPEEGLTDEEEYDTVPGGDVSEQ